MSFHAILYTGQSPLSAKALWVTAHIFLSTMGHSGSALRATVQILVLRHRSQGGMSFESDPMSIYWLCILVHVALCPCTSGCVSVFTGPCIQVQIVAYLHTYGSVSTYMWLCTTTAQYLLMPFVPQHRFWL
jgi:hypothetical protein